MPAAIDGCRNPVVGKLTRESLRALMHDPYAQLLSKIVRGFERDLTDARSFVSSGMVNVEKFRSLVGAIPDEVWSKYPRHSSRAVMQAVDEFLAEFG